MARRVDIHRGEVVSEDPRQSRRLLGERLVALQRATVDATFRIDVRPILSTITAPTLVIHAARRGCGWRCAGAGCG
jgi:hypothetical protein